MNRYATWGGRRRGLIRKRGAGGVGAGDLSPCLRYLLERGHFFAFLEGAPVVAPLLGIDADLISTHAVSLAPWPIDEPLPGDLPRVRISGEQSRADALEVNWDALKRAWIKHKAGVTKEARARYGQDRAIWGACVFDKADGWDGPGDWILGEGDCAIQGHDSFICVRAGNGYQARVPAGPVLRGTWFDGVMADRPAFFISRFCRQSKGKWAGQVVNLEDWQSRDLLWPIFGWRKANGLRLVKQAYCEIPKKNGKSTLLSAFAPYMLLADGEGGPEVYNAAVDRMQAGRVFDESVSMIGKSPLLSARLRVVPTKKSVFSKWNDGIQRALSADKDTAEGLNISALSVDEVHAHKKADLINTLRYGGDARAQPLAVFITTAGEYDPESIGYIMHEAAAKLISGATQDAAFWPLIYCAAPEDDWTAPEVWRKANPSLGTILEMERMEEACQEARNVPSKQNVFRRYRLNIWTNDVDSWLDPDAWMKCRADFSASDLHGRACYGGLDLAQSNDLAAFVLAFPPESSAEKWRVLSWHFMAAEVMRERAREHFVDYPQWAKDGWLTPVPGKMIDLSADGDMLQKLVDIAADFDMRECAYDKYLAAILAGALDKQHGWKMEVHRFGDVSMHGPMTETERLIVDQAIEHDGNPLMKWEMSNVVAITGTGGLMKPDKSTARKKIDGPVAMMMAIGRARVLTAEGVAEFGIMTA